MVCVFLMSCPSGPPLLLDPLSVRHRNTEAEENGGIGKRQSTTGDVVKDPPNGLLILQGVGLDYVLVYKLSMEDAQNPSPDSRASSAVTLERGIWP